MSSSRALIVFATFFLAYSLSVAAVETAETASRPPSPEYVPGELLVKLRPEAARTAGTMSSFAGRHALSRGRPILPSVAKRSGGQGLERVYLFSLAGGRSVEDTVAELNADPAVEYAEPNLIMRVQIAREQVAPDDPYYASEGSWGQDYADMWGLHTIGLSEPNSGWDIERDEEGNIIVAVIDTGLDFAHPDGPNVWTNPGETPGDGVDNDENGYIDDIHGWDFVNGDSDPTDGHGHGTHCAGTIAGQTNNATGIAGISWGSRIMPIKGLSDGGSGSTDGLAVAIMYAADNGANILSNSWGGVGYSQTLEDAVDYAAAKGCLVIAAAGNSAVDVDAFQFVPAVFENTMAVAASDPDDKVAYFSNHGPAIAVTAPGVDVLSLRASGTDMYGDGTHIVGENYYRSNGTSMACPHTAGLAALVWAHNLTWDATQVRNQIVHTTDYIDPLNPGYEGRLGSGRINAWKALSVSPQPDLVNGGVSVIPPESLLENGAPDPGETAGLSITLRNRWLTATGVTGRLISDDPYAAVRPDPLPIFFGEVPEGGTATVPILNAIAVSSEAPYGHSLDVKLAVRDGGGYEADIPLGLRVSAPWLSIRTAYVLDPEGNNNGLLEPGETADIQLSLGNAAGSALAESATAALVSFDPRIAVHQADAGFGDIQPGESGSNFRTPYVLEMAADFPEDGTAALRFEISAGHGYAATTEIEISPPGRRVVFWEETIPSWPPLSLSPVSAVSAPDGSIHTAYQDIRSTIEGIRYSQWSGVSWLEPEPVGRHYTYSYTPQVTVGPSSIPHAGYMEARLAPGWQPLPLTVRECYHSAREGEWTPPRAMADTWEIEALRDYGMAVDSGDRVHAAYMYMDWSVPNTLYWYHRIRVDGEWGARQVVHQTTDTQRNYASLRLTAGPESVLWMTWVRNPKGGNTLRELFGARWNGSAWASPTILLATDASLNDYQMVTDGEERLHLVWSDTVVKKRMYKMSQPGGGGWSEPYVLAETPNYSAYNSLHIDEDGILYFAYPQGGEIRTRMLDGGEWTPEETLLTLDPGENIFGLRLLTDGRGHRHLLWNSVTNYTLARTQHAMFPAYNLKEPPKPPVMPSLWVR